MTEAPELKLVAQRIFRQALAAVDVSRAMQARLEISASQLLIRDFPTSALARPPAGGAGTLRLALSQFDEILSIAFGKAAPAMAQALATSLAPIIHPISCTGILVAPKTASPPELPNWESFATGHPLPDSDSFAAGRAILGRLARTTARSLVLFLISGGGSALVEQPLDPALSLEDFQSLHGALVGCGASIQEINVIRKHLSAIKGGRLAAAAPHATKITFAISDVPQGQESALASGPTLPDPSTLADAVRICREFALLEKFPPAIRRLLESRKLPETPKPGEPAFSRAHFIVLLDSRDLLHASHRAAEAEGFRCLCDNSTDNSPLEPAADHLLAQLESQRRANPGQPIAVIADGELSSPVTGYGIGGRNAAFVLTCAPKIAARPITVLSAGTDGVDGNSPAAGAIADGQTLSRASSAGLDPADFLRRSDSHTFFSRLGDALITGPTGHNLRDLRLLLSR